MITLRLNQLKTGRIYTCALSGRPILVQRQRITGPRSGDPTQPTTTTTLYGWYYNPVYGIYQRTELKDHQLTGPVESVTES